MYKFMAALCIMVNNTEEVTVDGDYDGGLATGLTSFSTTLLTVTAMLVYGNNY